MPDQTPDPQDQTPTDAGTVSDDHARSDESVASPTECQGGAGVIDGTAADSFRPGSGSLARAICLGS